jgi:hypothetical protein
MTATAVFLGLSQAPANKRNGIAWPAAMCGGSIELNTFVDLLN